LTGGGTGGHVYPALAIKEIIEKDYPDAEFLYVGVKGKAEEYILNSLEDAARIPLKFIKASGLPRSVSPGKLLFFLKELIQGYIESRRIIAQFDPHLVIATGGYVTAPVVLAAKRRRRKILIHEQNSVPGLVNKTIGRFADRILLTFEETSHYFDARKTCLSGYPTRRRIQARNKSQARKALGIPEDGRAVFIFGGSTGAKIINEAIVQHFEILSAKDNLYIIHGTGKDRPGMYNAYSDTLRTIQERHAGILAENRYIIRDYFDDIDSVYAAADLVVCRAGAGTLMECAALGLPVIVIPKQGLPGDHQEKNAQAAERTGGAIIIREEKYNKQTILDGEKLTRAIINTVGDAEKLETMGNKIKKLYIDDTQKRISEEIKKLLAMNP